MKNTSEKNQKTRHAFRLRLPVILLAGCLLLSLTGCGSFFQERILPVFRVFSSESPAPSASPEEYPMPVSVLQEPEAAFDLSGIPAWNGAPWVAVNGNRPYFTKEALTRRSFEVYGDLDPLGRCTGAAACVGEDLLPTGDRESISEIRPSGWHVARYDGIEGGFLYNRCHLIAYGLTAENANERNLITGTRYLNYEGMRDFEFRTVGYIRRTGNHVLYRVTPIFEGRNLVASGVLMEAFSVEDRGSGICFCVYAYNVQPGVTIDYATGRSTAG